MWCRVPAGASSTSWPSKPGCSSRCAPLLIASASRSSCPSRMARPRCWSITRAKCWPRPTTKITCFDEVRAEYAPLRDNYSLTFSPSLPQGLNLGRQLFYLQTRRADIVQARRAPAAVSAVLGVAPVGDHGSGSDFARHAHRSVAPARTHLFDARAQAGLGAHDAAATSRQRASRPYHGPASPRRPASTPACEVACGIHDSNASYLRFLMDREREAFTVVSSGTWTIVMANRGDLRRLREDRDMLANVNAFGAPVATARYMGGREYEAIAQSGDEPTVDAVIEVLSLGCDRAAVIRQRRPVLRPARAPRRRRCAARHAARRAGHALFGADDRGAHRVSGRGRRNLRRRSAGAESAVRQIVSRVRAGGHGADLSGRRRHAGRGASGRVCLRRPPGALQSVAPLRLPGLLEYQANWRHRLEEK